MIMVGATTPAGIADERARMVMVHFIKKHSSLQCRSEKWPLMTMARALSNQSLLVPCRKQPLSLHETPGAFDRHGVIRSLNK